MDTIMAVGIYASGAPQDQHLVELGGGLEVEAVDTYDGGLLGLPDLPFDHPAVAINQFQFGEADEMAGMVGVYTLRPLRKQTQMNAIIIFTSRNNCSHDEPSLLRFARIDSTFTPVENTQNKSQLMQTSIIFKPD